MRIPHLHRSYAPTEELSPLRRDVDALLERFRRTGGRPLAPPFPAVDVTSDGERVRVTADLPGIARKDVSLAVEADRLVLSGARAEEEKGRERWRCERASGAFRREIDIPCEVDANKASAAMRDGVLTVDLPIKAEALHRRRILEIREA